MIVEKNKNRKYHNVKVMENGFVFDSKREHLRWCELMLLLKAKEISDLTVHPRYVLKAFDETICEFIPDFTYIDRDGKWIVEDVKGAATAKLPSFRVKLRLFHANFPSAHFRVVGIKKTVSLKRKFKPF